MRQVYHIGRDLMKIRPPPPDWFSLENYAFVYAQEDARSWLDALLRANAKLDPTWSAKKEEWRDIIGPEIDQMHDGYIPPPVVQLLEEPITLHPFELPALLINLNAPDGVILEQVEAALRAAREQHPPHVRKPGPPALNARFGKQQFSTWRRYKILPLADLLAWRTRQKDKISDAQLGLWLGFDEDRAAKEIELAKKELPKAIASIPALASQVASEAQAEKDNLTIGSSRKDLHYDVAD